MRRARNHTSSMVATAINAEGKRAAPSETPKVLNEAATIQKVNGRLVKVDETVKVRRDPIPGDQHLAPHLRVAALVRLKQGEPSQTREKQHGRGEEQQAQREGESCPGGWGGNPWVSRLSGDPMIRLIE